MVDNSGLGVEEKEFQLWSEMKHCNLDQLHADLASDDDLRRFTAAKELQLRGDSATFTFAEQLSKAPNALPRQVAAFILGQLGTPNRPFLQVSVPILKNLLDCDLDARVRATAAASLGHLGSPEGFENLRKASLDVDANVRANVAFALGKMDHDERSVQPLLSLTRDSDSEVVCWAILGLCSLDIDLPIVRNRLVEMLRDVRENILDEVICCLANWRDIRVLPSILDALNREEINFDLIEAAGNFGDERILPRLKALLHEWGNDSPRVLLQAIERLETH